MLITIITVAYNCVAEIEKTILSVVRQDYDNLQYIIIDGGSTDGTVDVIKKYSDKIDYWVSEKDGGVYFAMNKGLDVAKGKWTNFMNAGDTFADSSVISRMFKDKHYSDEVGMVYGDTISICPFGSFLVPGSTSMCHQSVFCRTDLLQRFRFDTSYRIIADQKIFRQVKQNSYICQYIPVPVSRYDSYSGISATSPVRFYEELSRLDGTKRNLRWKLSVMKLYLELFLRKLKGKDALLKEEERNMRSQYQEWI